MKCPYCQQETKVVHHLQAQKTQSRCEKCQVVYIVSQETVESESYIRDIKDRKYALHLWDKKWFLDKCSETGIVRIGQGDYVKNHITPSNVVDKIKLYLTFQ
jgi:hypothetical protein